VNTHRHNNNYNEEKRAPEYSKISTDEMKPSGRILYSKGFAREIEYNNARAPEYSKIRTDEMKPPRRILYSKGFARDKEYNNTNLFPVDSMSNRSTKFMWSSNIWLNL